MNFLWLPDTQHHNPLSHSLMTQVVPCSSDRYW